MNQGNRQVIFLFVTAVIVYGVIVSFFTSTVHIDVDEELYIALARSFHYCGRFEYKGEIQNYSCVLYSMLISLAYYIYSPDKILFVMRMLGVVVMCSSVFPIYFLAKDVLGNGKKAVFLSCLLMIMPYMFDSAYLMQEVLSYPLFVWVVYFMNSFYNCVDTAREGRHLVYGAIFSVLCFFTKTYMFFIPVTVNLCALYYAREKRDRKRYMISIVIYDIIYLLLFAGIYFGIYALNGFERGYNHYSNQFSNLFPISWNTIIYGTLGVIVYLALFIINTGILPSGVMLWKWRKKERSWLFLFLIISSLFLMIEIIYMIVLTEEGTGNLPHKFLFRYFHIFVPVILILLFNYKDEMERYRILYSCEMRVITVVSLGVALGYFVCMRGNTRQAIMDGHLFLFIENVTKYVLPCADVTGILMLLIILGWIVSGKHGITIKMGSVLKTWLVCIGLFWIIETVQLPYYTNVIAGGEDIQEDSIKIAEYLNAEGYEYIYYIYNDIEERESYLRNFYGYVKQPYQVVAKDEIVKETLKTDEKKKTLYIFPKESKARDGLTNLEQVDLHTEKFSVWVLDGHDSVQTSNM